MHRDDVAALVGVIHILIAQNQAMRNELCTVWDGINKLAELGALQSDSIQELMGRDNG